MLEYYDISPEISARTAVFPGDAPFNRTIGLDFKKGDHLLTSSIQTTVHIGAHTDAPNHYQPGTNGIEARDLNYYLGPCQVISVNIPRGKRILPSDIADVKISEKRILFKTGSFPDPNQWNADFNSLSPELIHHLARSGVILVGIDTPSVDPAEDQALPSHHAIHEHDLAILEGVVLEPVPDGVYTLIALPLRIKDADASPVRAILMTGQLWKN